MRPTPLISLLLLLLAGCLAPGGALDEAATPAWDALRTAIGEVPCEGAGNLKVVAEDALDAEGGASHGELALATSFDRASVLAAVARYQLGGFDLVDVTDPLAPRVLSTWDPEGAVRALDVKFTTDNATLIVASDASIRLFDVRAPAAPVMESETKLAKPQAHMLAAFHVAGQEWLAAVKGEGYDIEIFRVVGEPGGRTLELAAHPKLNLLGEPTGQDLLRSHDAWFHVDEKLGEPLLWVASSWDGIHALDVSDPTKPVIVASIPNADPYQAYTHTVQTTWVKEKRVVVAVNEVGLNALKVYDATDLASPRLVALWHVPLVVQPQHNLQVVGTRAYVAHYGEGVYVFDLANLTFAPVPERLEPVAHLASGDASAGASPLPGGGTWDVVVRDGLLYTSEINGGMRVVAYGCLTPGDAAASSTG